jgi:hypothetical protein
VVEDSSFPECDAVLLDESFLAFQWIVMPTYSRVQQSKSLIFEDEDIAILCNFGNHSTIDRNLHSRIIESSTTPF